MSNNELELGAGYSRESRLDNDDVSTSIENQKTAIKMYAFKNNIKLIANEDDNSFSKLHKDWSGELISRPYVEHLLELAKQKKFKYLIIKSASRLGRGDAQKILINKFRFLGIEIISLSNDLGDLMKEHITQFIDTFPVIRAKMDADFLQKSKQEKQLAFIPCYVGYKYNEKKEWIIDEPKAEIVRQINKSNAWKKSLGVSEWSYNRIKTILAFGGYTKSIIQFKKAIKDPQTKKVIRYETIEYQGKHPAIILTPE